MRKRSRIETFFQLGDTKFKFISTGLVNQKWQYVFRHLREDGRKSFPFSLSGQNVEIKNQSSLKSCWFCPWQQWGFFWCKTPSGKLLWFPWRHVHKPCCCWISFMVNARTRAIHSSPSQKCGCGCCVLLLAAFSAVVTVSMGGGGIFVFSYVYLFILFYYCCCFLSCVFFCFWKFFAQLMSLLIFFFFFFRLVSTSARSPSDDERCFSKQFLSPRCDGFHPEVSIQ